MLEGMVRGFAQLLVSCVCNLLTGTVLGLRANCAALAVSLGSLQFSTAYKLVGTQVNLNRHRM